MKKQINYILIIISFLLISCSKPIKIFQLDSDGQHIELKLYSDSTFIEKGEDNYSYSGTWSGNLSENSKFKTIATKKRFQIITLISVKEYKIVKGEAILIDDKKENIKDKIEKNTDFNSYKKLETISRDSLNKFLIKPFALFEFKKKKGMSNSGGVEAKKYYYKPNKKGMYYQYFFFSKLKGYIGRNKNNILRKKDGLIITVYKKLGKYQYEYNDPTEELIEVKAKFNDFDLPELAMVGLDSNIIIERFGHPDIFQTNNIVYQYENKS